MTLPQFLFLLTLWAKAVDSFTLQKSVCFRATLLSKQCLRSTATNAFHSDAIKGDDDDSLLFNDLNERGVMTKLKRKHDVTEYLEDHLDHSLTAEAIECEDGTKDRETLQKGETKKTDASTQLSLPPKIKGCIPPPVQDRMQNLGISELLPVQLASFERIFQGRDTIVQAPTGSGKSLAFVLPLVCGKKPLPWLRKRTASPRILTICPSRELARQVGKEWSKFQPKNTVVSTVFGGVPIERHLALLKQKPQVVVSTPGRLRELVREGHLDYSQLTTVVLDEADMLLDTADSPDVQAIMNEIESSIGKRDEHPEFQLVMVSATINSNVRDFAEDLQISPRAFISISNDDSMATFDTSKKPKDGKGEIATNNVNAPSSLASKVQHWHMSCKTSVFSSITTDLISILAPRLTIVFVPTKSETELVSSYLTDRLSRFSVRLLHGDMSQMARSRTMMQIRKNADHLNQVLVATDVAARGLDLPIDLVVQFGVPRIAGKDGTFSTELYTHRTGRTGRFRMGGTNVGERETTNAVLLYDPAVGEGRLIPDLVKGVRSELGIEVKPRPMPSSFEVAEAAYGGLSASMVEDLTADDHDLASYFRHKLHADSRFETSDPDQLLDLLAQAMARMSGLDPSISPGEQSSSLLTGDPSFATVRLSGDSPLSPPEVTKLCKGVGSGKLGRVTICGDGSAVFDMPVKRAAKLVEAINEIDCQWRAEIPLSLPAL